MAAGYVLYSASTELVLTFGQGVVGFTLDTSTLGSRMYVQQVLSFVVAYNFSVNIMIDMLFILVLIS